MIVECNNSSWVCEQVEAIIKKYDDKLSSCVLDSPYDEGKIDGVKLIIEQLRNVLYK